MALFTKIKKVKVLRSAFSKIFDLGLFIQYMVECIAKGSKYSLFKDPNITTGFYDLGTAAYESIQLAVKDGNLLVIDNSIISGKKWMYAYADQVEEISNDDANCTTRGEAAANISQSRLTPQKLAQGRKGKPERPVITGERFSGGIFKMRITNGKSYKPKKTLWVAVSRPSKDSKAARPVVKIINGLLDIRISEAAHIVYAATDGKGKITYFTGIDPMYRI